MSDYSARVWVDPEVPLEITRAVQPVVERWLHLLPRWMQVLVVTWDSRPSTKEDSPAEMSVRIDYRVSYLTIFGNWLDQDDPERNRVIRHEFLHSAVGPYRNAALDGINTLAKLADLNGDSALYQHITEDLRTGLEQTIVDLEEIVQRVRITTEADINEGNPPSNEYMPPPRAKTSAALWTGLPRDG